MFSLVSYVIRLLFPPKCVICNNMLLKENELCETCLPLWESARRAKCPVCHKTARACICRTFHMTDTDSVGDRSISALGFYKKFGSDDPVDRLVLRLVTAVKTREEKSAIRFCARELSHEILKTFILDGRSTADWRITFPPRSKKRVRKYGFDHGKELCKYISKYTGIRYQQTLTNSAVLSQKHLNSLERKKNADSSYRIRKKTKIEGNYIVVDDIVTTGATINAVASALKSAGAGSVYPVCIAKTKKKKRRLRRPAERPWFTAK
ncbi:MAG: ComF family protein [Clostridia bacterium]|nr:ComF family protein [Clostridia bacterium]